MGDFRANGAGWENLTIVAGISGYSIAALSISYILPVFQAALKNRRVAAFIGALGGTPENLVRNYRGESCLVDHLNRLTLDIIEISENHKAYPVLHFFHDSDAQSAFAVQVAVLDEALTVLQTGFKSGPTVDKGVTKPLRRAISLFLNSIKQAHMQPAPSPPPPRDLEALEAESQTTDPKKYADALDQLKQRRQALLGLVTSHGWSWDDLSRASEHSEDVELEFS